MTTRFSKGTDPRVPRSSSSSSGQKPLGPGQPQYMPDARVEREFWAIEIYQVLLRSAYV